MSTLQLLNNVEHQNLKIVTENRAEFGDNVGGSLVFPEEFLSVHREYPILFQKEPESGKFQIICLFGLQKDENLFLTESGWSANYVPALMRREPFMIGFQSGEGVLGKKVPVIHVDMSSPRISANEEGEPVFLENGGNSPYLEDVKACLMLVHKGLDTSAVFIQVLAQHDLIEQMTLDVVFDDGAALKTNAYYTISRDKLDALEGTVIADLHSKGILQLIYIMQNSLGNIKYLIARHNKLL